MSQEKFHPTPDYKVPHVNPLTWVARWASYQIESRYLPTTVIDEYKTLQSLSEKSIAREGNIIVFTHFGRGDLIPLLFNIICHAPHIRSRPAIAPQSWHQYSPKVDRFMHALGGKLMPIVNENTEKHEDFKDLAEDLKEQIRTQLNDNYLRVAAGVLSKGGTVAFAVDAGRRQYLDMSMQHRAFAVLHSQLKRMKCTATYGVIPVALSLKGVTDYSDANAGDINLDQEYVMRIGPRIPAAQVSTLRSAHIEELIRDKLFELAPLSYIDPAYLNQLGTYYESQSAV